MNLYKNRNIKTVFFLIFSIILIPSCALVSPKDVNPHKKSKIKIYSHDVTSFPGFPVYITRFIRKPATIFTSKSEIFKKIELKAINRGATAFIDPRPCSSTGCADPEFDNGYYLDAVKFESPTLKKVMHYIESPSMIYNKTNPIDVRAFYQTNYALYWATKNKYRQAVPISISILTNDKSFLQTNEQYAELLHYMAEPKYQKEYTWLAINHKDYRVSLKMVEIITSYARFMLEDLMKVSIRANEKRVTLLATKNLYGLVGLFNYDFWYRLLSHHQYDDIRLIAAKALIKQGKRNDVENASGNIEFKRKIRSLLLQSF